MKIQAAFFASMIWITSSLHGRVTPSESDANKTFKETPPLPSPSPAVQGKFNVRFVGAKNIPESELRQAGAEIISSIQSEGLTAPRADDAAFYTEVYYRRRGFTYAIVDWQILDGGSTLELTIDEGPLTTIDGITLRGNDHFASAVLTDFVIGTTRERFSRLQTTLPYVEQDIQTGLDRLTGFYRSEGFLDAQVLPWPVEYSTDLTKVKLGASIVEGLQYWFGQISITGVSPAQERDLRDNMENLIKLPYTELHLESLQSQLQLHLKSQGYFEATVAVTPDFIDTGKGLISVTIAVQPGEKFTFDGITATGIERLRPNFLTGRFAFLTGKTYDPILLDEVYREVVGTGLFSEFKIRETPIDNHQVRLDLSVQESPAKEFGLYGGFGTYEGGFVGTSYQDRDLFGFGRPVTTSVEFSQRGITGSVEYVDPWFFTRGNELRVRLFSSTIDNDGYAALELGIRAELTKKFSKEWRGSIFILAKATETTAQEITPSLLGPLRYQTVSAGASLTVDYRNNPLAPGRGWVLDSALANTRFSSGASGLNVSLRLSYYLPMGNWLLALGARTSAFLTSESVAAIPIDDRYFNGGGTTVRSYDERQLGPLYQDHYPLGGLSRMILNTELIIPVISDLKAAVFVDAGNLLPSDSLFSTKDFHSAFGLGLRYNLPVGPLRLDYGFNPSPGPGEKAGAFHFSFGFAF